MKYGQYVFQYRIGVFYKDYKWARNLLDEYIKSIPKECIKCINKNKLILKNNSCIILAPATTAARGQRFDRVIIQKGIEKEIINCIIRPLMLNELITFPENEV